MKSFLLFSCCLTILTGCNSSTNDDNNRLITFDLSNQLNSEEPLNLSEFISSISYIPLETSAEALLDNVKFVIPAEDLLIVGTFKHQLKVFKVDGKYKNDIGQIGKGPGEFTNFGNVFWDNNTKEVIVHTFIDAKLKFYTINGSFIRDFPTPYPAWEVFRMHDGIFLGINRFPTQIDSTYTKYFLFDLNGLVKAVLPVTKESADKNPTFYVNHYHCLIGDMDLLSRPRSDTIFLYENQNLIPFASFNLSNQIIPDEVYYNRDLPPSAMGDFILFFVPKPAGQGRFFLDILKQKKTYTALCDINDGFTKVIRKDKKFKYGITNDVDGGYPFIPSSNFFSQSYYTSISTFTLISQRDKGLYQNAGTNFLNLLNRLKPDDNPVVAVYKLK
jgi:hypothetical protein